MYGFSAILTVTVVVGFFDSDTLFMVVASENVSSLPLVVSSIAFYKKSHCVRWEYFKEIISMYTFLNIKYFDRNARQILNL